MNVKLLNQIMEHILEEPRRANMDMWLQKNSHLYKHDCHTVGCIAGWAVMLEGEKEEQTYLNTRMAAIRLLKLPEGRENELFLVTNWPAGFRVRLDKHPEGTKAYAQAIVARIKDYIKQYEAEAA